MRKIAAARPRRPAERDELGGCLHPPSGSSFQPPDTAPRIHEMCQHVDMAPPPPAYRGPGEVSANFRPASAPPNIAISDSVAHYLATGDTTDGGFAAFRWDIGVGGMSAPPHFHRTFSESFFVLSGTVSLYNGNRWVDARPGDFLHVPAGGVHAFRDDSSAPVSFLVIIAPGVPREAFFGGLAELTEGGRNPDSDQLAAFYTAHDTFPVSI